jgi:purine-binding chemotaxis protein CheW
MSELLVIAIIAGRRCAIRAVDVHSVIETGDISPIPRTPEHIIGLTALRSQALTVVDCRLSLGLPLEGLPTDERAAVVKVGGHSYALQVDAIEDVEQATSEPAQVPGGFGTEWTRAGEGMVETSGGPALLIRIDQIVAGTGEVMKVA